MPDLVIIEVRPTGTTPAFRSGELFAVVAIVDLAVSESYHHKSIANS